MITGAMKIAPTKLLEMRLDLPTLGVAVETGAPIAACHLLRPDPRNLGIGHNQTWAKTDRIKLHVTLSRTFGKYPIVVPTREEWGKKWPSQLRKGHIWFTDEACDQQGTRAGICKLQSKIQWHISLEQDAIAFQADIVAILDCVTGCPRKRMVKEHITNYTDL